MKSRDFCYWLMGSLEMNPENEENGLDEKQTQILKNHLNMCFAHVVTKEGELKPRFDGREVIDGLPKVNC